MKKKMFLSLLVVLSLFLITGCSLNKKENVNNNDISEDLKNIKIIPDDANDYNITVFMNGYKDLVIPQIVYLMENNSISNTEFAKQYIDLYKKSTYENLSIKEKDFFNIYARFIFGMSYKKENADKEYNINDIWSINYESDNKVDKNGCKNYISRGFFIIFSSRNDELLISSIHKASLSSNNSEISYSFIDNNGTVFKEKYGVDLGTNIEKILINSNAYCEFNNIYDDSGDSYYIYENKDNYQKIVDDNKEFFNYVREYAKVYWVE